MEINNCYLGILYQEILECSLRECFDRCVNDGNMSRAQCVSDLRKLLFNDGYSYID